MSIRPHQLGTRSAHHVCFPAFVALTLLLRGGSALAQDSAPAPVTDTAPDEKVVAPTPAQTAVTATRMNAGADSARGRSSRLEASLSEHANISATVRTWSGISELVIGAASVVSAARMLSDDAGGWGKSRSSAALTGTLFAFGGTLLASAVTRWLTDTAAEHRFDRWNELSDDQKADAREQARFEGELASEADVSKERKAERIPFGIGFVAGGGTMLGLGAASVFGEGARTTAYVMGGCYIGIGAFQIVSALLSDSLAETIWRRYQTGDAEALSTLHLPVPTLRSISSM